MTHDDAREVEKWTVSMRGLVGKAKGRGKDVLWERDRRGCQRSDSDWEALEAIPVGPEQSVRPEASWVKGVCPSGREW